MKNNKNLHSTFYIPHPYKGFTLIELLLYVGVAATILLTSTLFIQALLESRIKNQTIAEVEQQGLQAVQHITQAIRNAESVTSPTTGSSASSLTLDVVEAGDDPTVFDVSANTIRITEGSSDPITLTNTRVNVSSLTFENLSRTDTPGTVRISFTLSHVNNSGRQEYEYQKTFYTSASLRDN